MEASEGGEGDRALRDAGFIAPLHTSSRELCPRMWGVMGAEP